MTVQQSDTPGSSAAEPAEDQSWLDVLLPIAENWILLLVLPLIAGALALSATYLMTPVFTARTTFLAPQQHGSAMAALNQLGALANLAGGSAGLKSPADQYVALMQSVTVSDRVIDQFSLMTVFRAEHRFLARQALANRVRIAAGKKDGLITVEVDDTDPKRAASIANQYISELRKLTGELALTEAQQRRMFFEGQLKRTRDHLSDAQRVLQATGFNPGALKAEPRAAAESYARLRAEVAAGEVRLQTLRQMMADGTPEVRQQLGQLSALRSQLAKSESLSQPGPDENDFIGKFREYKYQETMFELLTKQFDLARLDESREAALIQVVDTAEVPEWKSKPRRSVFALTVAVVCFFALLTLVFVRRALKRSRRDPVTAKKLQRLRGALLLR